MSEVNKEVEETKQAYPYTVSIRFHNNSKSYTFGTELNDLENGDMVVVETAQGVELGTCHTPSISTDDYPVDMNLKPVLRKALDSDIAQYKENIELAKDALKVCEEEVEKLGLGMHLLSAEFMLDRSKVLFIYQADARVDFRELLKKLGARLHCRIELRQIGERDIAKMVGGIGMCGMECCCARFKTNLEVVSINMAKTQLLALNTEKLSGMCGKLMCCLRYENDNYKEMTKGLPKIGAHVEYDGEIYRVTSMNVLTDEARIENHEHSENITIQQLKEETVVRKGVPITRYKPGQQRSNTRNFNARAKENAIEKGTFKNEKTLDISSLEKADKVEKRKFKHKEKDKDFNKDKDHRKKNTKNKRNDSRPYNKDQKERRMNARKNKRNVNRNYSKPTGKVEVRSFKSSKTKAKETGGKK